MDKDGGLRPAFFSFAKKIKNTVGDAYVPRDYHEQSIDITDPLIDYLRDGDRSWDQLIWGIYRVIEGDK